MPCEFSLENIELVHHMNSSVTNLKEGLKIASEMDSAMFYTSIVVGENVFAQPMVIPVKLANPLAQAIMLAGFMDTETFTKHVQNGCILMALNNVRPAPIEAHFSILEIFERILYTGMQDNKDEVAKLAELTSGDLVVVQLVVKSDTNEVVSGLRVVKEPLRIMDSGITASFSFPTNPMVH